ncbi:hypothetical protein [Polynucleobacter sp. MWH-Svant-W18]|uniref:hypothetical protein n=1 Tax=Polynucleobacter sp. MWH-Svant-W18 TaxID=1855909 RepID=UPI001BFDAE2D|nr:hypothetical protein [Polynucleobacter sp. MWH-Svant-W18]QWD78262.1 hypothetical protein C2757_01530 [Polynucleobacter sp. MWH-Svant-W18]
MRMCVEKSLVAVLSLGLVACGGFPTTHPDAAKNTPANYKADLKDCAQSYPETPDGVYLKQRITCMKLKGWQ